MQPVTIATFSRSKAVGGQSLGKGEQMPQGIIGLVVLVVIIIIVLLVLGVL